MKTFFKLNTNTYILQKLHITETGFVRVIKKRNLLRWPLCPSTKLFLFFVQGSNFIPAFHCSIAFLWFFRIFFITIVQYFLSQKPDYLHVYLLVFDQMSFYIHFLIEACPAPICLLIHLTSSTSLPLSFNCHPLPHRSILILLLHRHHLVPPSLGSKKDNL